MRRSRRQEEGTFSEDSTLESVALQSGSQLSAALSALLVSDAGALAPTLELAGCPPSVTANFTAPSNGTNSTACTRFSSVASALSQLLDVLIASAVGGESPVSVGTDVVEATVQRVLGLASADPTLQSITEELVELVNNPGDTLLLLLLRSCSLPRAFMCTR